jgi:hypothetical protein
MKTALSFAVQATAPPGASETKPMTDLIFIAVIALFFIASDLYSHWCGKL